MIIQWSWLQLRQTDHLLSVDDDISWSVWVIWYHNISHSIETILITLTSYVNVELFVGYEAEDVIKGIILGMCPARERWCYIVTWPLICWAHAQNYPCDHDGYHGVNSCGTAKKLGILTLNMLNCFKDYKRYIHSHFESYLGICLTQVDEINSGTTIHVVCPTQPIPCLMMPWRV